MNDNDFEITDNAPTTIDEMPKPASNKKKPGPLSYLDWIERLEKAAESNGGVLTAKDCQNLAKLMRGERAKAAGSEQSLTRIAG